MDEKELLGLTAGELTDLGICPTCFNRQHGQKHHLSRALFLLTLRRALFLLTIRRSPFILTSVSPHRNKIPAGQNPAGIFSLL